MIAGTETLHLRGLCVPRGICHTSSEFVYRVVQGIRVSRSLVKVVAPGVETRVRGIAGNHPTVLLVNDLVYACRPRKQIADHDQDRKKE